MDQLKLEDIDIYRVLSSMHEGILIADVTGKVRFYNETQARIDDLDPEDVLGKKIKDIYQLDDNTSPTMRCLKSGQSIMNETLVYRTRLGKVANIISNVYPLYKSGILIGAIEFCKDYQLLEKSIVIEQKDPKRKKKGNQAQFHFSDIIGSHPDMRNAVRIARMSSDSPSPIMICGETGTGKELFAQSIHNHSTRKKKPFIPINCAAIPENLLEGILFGTSKGAFTGAINKSGLLEQANGGSVFLDELDSMPMMLQAKLLRVIQERKVRRLGAPNEIELNIKIISSVGHPPLEMIQKGALRMDLFYRMGVVFILLPPLRERKDELNELIQYFIAEYNKILNVRVDTVSKNVSDLFLRYHWPGNVRELKHVIEASMNMVARGRTIRLGHLPAHIFSFAKKDLPSLPGAETTMILTPGRDVLSSDLHQAQAENERQIIGNALKSAEGNAAKAARSLGISPQSFHYKLKKYGLMRKEVLPKSK
ncbi:MAG: sigma 54-interacting transcriptional regulator [Deltaproteobacteria bacterium]|uniref:sigma-54 interaction domain-containing protein n=1 Tax=Desulfobacula sp. TaxID=2593537 RepID=UPI0019BC6A7C|nr:sigma 54-interacting transcriptional regulator [Candidatus Desulfobacula maris]MBL6992437.1 sigma 54-interacting transcriptional regulator [Desulfobacula sp.]